MSHVLDTCSFLWLVGEPARLSSAAQAALGNPGSFRFVSVITLVEINRLNRRGAIHLDLTVSLLDWFEQTCGGHAIQIIPITASIAAHAEALPWIHKDPADRFIIATAHELGAKLITPDTFISQYPGIEVVW